MNARAILRGAALVAVLGFSLDAAATKITIVNADAAGVGFNDPTPKTPVGGNAGTTVGEQRLNVFKYAAAIWESQIDSPVEILVRATFEPLPCTSTSATLGSASATMVFTNFRGAPLADTWYASALADKLAGEDLCPSTDAECGTGEDIRARFTTAFDDGSCTYPRKWYYGLDASPTFGTLDFATVIIHELGHGLGFQTYYDRTTGKRFNDTDDAYMVLLYDATAGKTWGQMTDAERLASTTNTTNLLWDGAAVKAVAGSVLQTGLGAGGRPMMYAPNPSEAGSSVSHWDVSLFPNEVMEPSYANPTHSLLITDELMKDLGWGLASGTPEYHWLLPSSARAPGKGGAFYTTDLSVGNRGGSEARFKLKFLGNNADGTGGPESSELVLGPNQSVTYLDILGSIFGRTTDYGAVRLTANVTTLSVTGQTSTADPSKPGGTFGQSVPAFAASDLITAGVIRSIVGVREDASFRTNVVLTNGGTAPVTVNGTLLSTSGAVLASGTWTLPALGMTQVSVKDNMGVTSARDAQLLLSTSTSGGAFAAYASVIDNVTNDPRTLLPR